MTRTEAWTKESKRKDFFRRSKSFAGLDFFGVFGSKGEKAKNIEKNQKNFKKGLAKFRIIEYNVEDVCKGDEVTDCSLACEVTVMDHVRQSDDGSRIRLQGTTAKQVVLEYEQGGKEKASNKIRIKHWAYEHSLVDQAAERIVETARRTGSKVSGPIPLPTEREVVTILRSPHKYKDSREQFEQRTHKRLIDVQNPTRATFDAMEKLDLPAGVEIEIKL